jgi:hypothetical protein
MLVRWSLAKKERQRQSRTSYLLHGAAMRFALVALRTQEMFF